MPIAAFTFGSFGDILALVDLAIQVHAALSSSAGASEDYQALVSELHSFSQLLQNVQTIHTLTLHGLNRDPPTVSLQNAIRFALERSKVLLDTICAKIAGYQKSLRRGGSGNMMKDSWRKIGWAIFKKDEIQEMRRQLGGCTQSITAHLSVSQSYVPQLLCSIPPSMQNYNSLLRIVGHLDTVSLDSSRFPLKMESRWRNFFFVWSRCPKSLDIHGKAELLVTTELSYYLTCLARKLPSHTNSV